MGEQWHVVDGGPERMNAITESEDATSGALAYVGREDRNKDADARLIAAAPELLQACKGAYNFLDSGYTTGPSLGEIEDALRKAVMKAEGRKQA